MRKLLIGLSVMALLTLAPAAMSSKDPFPGYDVHPSGGLLICSPDKDESGQNPCGLLPPGTLVLVPKVPMRQSSGR